MGFVLAVFLLVAMSTSVLSTFVYASWNLILAPWMGWREMPVEVAALAGFTFSVITVKVRKS